MQVTCAVEFSVLVLTLVRVWTSLLLTMSRAVSIVHYITDNVIMTAVFVFSSRRETDLLRCKKQRSRFMSDCTEVLEI